jgi:signal transduction histidine kinase
MKESTSLLQDILQARPQVKAQIYFKTALTALSHAMEDLVLEGTDRPLVIANFQQERYYSQETRRYQRIAGKTDQVYVMAAPETAFSDPSEMPYARIALNPLDELAQEWHLVIVGDKYCACLVCREHSAPVGAIHLDSARQFLGFWTFEAETSRQVASLLLQRIVAYRADLAPQVQEARDRYGLDLAPANPLVPATVDVELFTARLVTYLQASQYKQVKSYVNLEQLNRQLASIEQAQNNLIAIVGHELRTPLSTIQVCLESLSEEPDMPAEYRKVMLETALEDSERLRKLIQDFLLLSKLEGNLTHWQIEPIDLADSIALALSNLRSQSRALPKITVEVAVDLPPVMADGEALLQLFTKLLDNACKFTPSDGNITIRAKRSIKKNFKSDTKQQVSIEIIDTGVGIEPQRLNSIFERFYQEEGFLQRAIGGTGLGLAISRQLVKRLGGKIWASSGGKGQGSQFHIVLPLTAD